MTAADFTQFLVMECEDTNSTTYVNSLLTAAKAQITAGNGAIGFIQSASGNGKTVNQLKGLSADEVAFCCRQALRLYSGDVSSSPFTFLNFSGVRPVPPCPPES